MEMLTRYSWLENIRELQNFIERAVILSNGSMLTPSCAETMGLKHPISTEPVTLIDVERAHIVRILGQVNGEMTRAAALLGIPRTTLFYKIRRLGIDVLSARRPKTDSAR
jgi:DNA-binding NtrC family response regulator